MVSLIFWLFGEQFAYLPLILRTFVVTFVVVLLMSWVLMPWMTRIFQVWLYPGP